VVSGPHTFQSGGDGPHRSVVFRVQTVTSHQQETVSKTTADLITQINNFLRRRRRADRWSAAAAASDLRRRAD
jgi:hypothetical protein